jgi:PAS domain S-box-containing protein
MKLRVQAEEQLKKKKGLKKNLAISEAEHELNVHKIELEMQNSELLISQNELNESNSRYTQLFEFAPLGYYILNEKGKIIDVNIKGCQLLKSTKQNLKSKNLGQFFNSAQIQDNFYKHRNLVFETKKIKRMQCEIKRSDNSVFYALVQSSILTDSTGEFKQMLTTIVDITIQKTYENALEVALEKERDLNEMKSQFITIASHEFRTPLATVLTSAELMATHLNQFDQTNSVKHLRKIKTSISRLKEILLDFLSTEDIKNDRINNNPETFNLATYINTLLPEIKSYNGIHAIKFIHKGLNNEVKLDKKLLKICLTNLMINAFKFSPEGGPVELKIQNSKKGVIITVKDNGIGIPEDDQRYIFKSFFRANNTANIQGTGLGLNITQKIVTIMGGNISFKSKLNKGTTFKIEFN